jgi:hypothetical protein
VLLFGSVDMSQWYEGKDSLRRMRREEKMRLWWERMLPREKNGS